MEASSPRSVASSNPPRAGRSGFWSGGAPIAPSGRARLTYYVNYAAMPAARVGEGLEAAFFTHVEDDVPAAAERFFAAGRRVDVAICMAARYAARLRDAGARDVRLATPGVDAPAPAGHVNKRRLKAPKFR